MNELSISIKLSHKDLGKKWFAFSKMDSISVASIIKSISGLTQEQFSSGQEEV